MLPHHHLYEAAWGAAGLLWGLGGALLLRRRTGAVVPWRNLVGLVALAVAATLFGARAHFVALAPDLLATSGWRALVGPLPEGAGLRITGGLVAGGLVLALLGPRATRGHLGRGAIADVLVPATGIAIALGRLGCFAEGCCFGIPCTGPWCVRFATESPAWWSHAAQGLVPTTAAASLAVHPVQLYLGLSALVATIASHAAFHEPSSYEGARALTFVVLLALLRAAIEPLRETRFGAGVPHEAMLDLAIAAVALGWLGLLAWRRRTQRGVGRAASGS
jgi:prolipoprotein diacylglyceryltransferase